MYTYTWPEMMRQHQYFRPFLFLSYDDRLITFTFKLRL